MAKRARKPAKKAKKKAASRKPPKLMAFRGGQSHEDDDVCSCDFHVGEADATGDAQLPAAMGGVAQA